MRQLTLQPSLAPDPLATERRSYGTRFVDLIEAALSGDQETIQRIGSLFAQEYQGTDRREVHGRIAAALRKRVTPIDQMRSVERLPVDNKTRAPLIETQPWPDIPLLLDEDVDAVVGRFILEAKHAERLANAGLGSRANLLLSGPPGTGKTFIAGHVAARLGLPFHIVRLDSVVSSLLGDTAKNIRALFEFAAGGPGLLFLDEIDAIAKRRDDGREMGEIKRVVNTLIQGLDLLPHRSVIIAATNHAHLLDPAIFRRFPYHLDIGMPGADLRGALWALYLEDAEVAEPLAHISDGLSCSDIRELAIAARRTAMLFEKPLDRAALAQAVLRSETGRLRMPASTELADDARSELLVLLREKYDLTYEKAGQLAGVSKQAALGRVKRATKRKGKTDV